MKTSAMLVLATSLSLLSACGERSAPQPDPSASTGAPQTVIGRSVQKGMDKARATLATENISLTSFNVSGGSKGVVITTDTDNPGDARPKAEITPQGDLLIEGRKIAANPQQHALLKDYRKQVEGIANTGMDIGVQGAELGVMAATEAIKGVFSGNPDAVEQRVGVEAEKIKLSARKLCDQLPAMLQTQTRLAAAMPEFKPYATMDQGDIDDCYDDKDLTPEAQQQVREEVRQEVRESIRTGIRESIQNVAQGSGPARSDNSGTDAAAEAEAASAADTSKQ